MKEETTLHTGVVDLTHEDHTEVEVQATTDTEETQRVTEVDARVAAETEEILEVEIEIIQKRIDLAQENQDRNGNKFTYRSCWIKDKTK
jgi:hypothetical protein